MNRATDPTDPIQQASDLEGQRRHHSVTAQEATIEAVKGKPAEAIKLPPKVKTFTVKHRALDGRLLEGKFTTRIPSVLQKFEIGAYRARLLGGTPPEWLDPDVVNLAEKVAQMAVIFKGQQLPEWAADLLGEDDPTIVEAIYKEVAAHHEMFLEACRALAASQGVAG